METKIARYQMKAFSAAAWCVMRVVTSWQKQKSADSAHFNWSDIIQTLIMNHQDEITWYCILCHHTLTSVWLHFSRTRHESLLDVKRSWLHTLLRSGCFVRSPRLWDSGGFWPGFPSFYLEKNKPPLLSLIQLFPPLSTFLCKKLVVLNKITGE